MDCHENQQAVKLFECFTKDLNKKNLVREIVTIQCGALLLSSEISSLSSHIPTNTANSLPEGVYIYSRTFRKYIM